MIDDPNSDASASDASRGDRRPLASRDTGWARALARQAVAFGLTPNAISMASLGFAAVAAIGFWMAAGSEGGVGAGWLLIAALGCQLRLLCNLIDGMVAIEGGLASATGAIWNEVPDRLSDVLVLAAAGVVADAPALGLAAAVASVLTAYVRELGHRLTGTADFGGWMAKPQRMAVVTLACVIAIGARLLGVAGDTVTFRVALGVVLLGAIWVALVRTRRLLHDLHAASSR